MCVTPQTQPCMATWERACDASTTTFRYVARRTTTTTGITSTRCSSCLEDDGGETLLQCWKCSGWVCDECRPWAVRGTVYCDRCRNHDKYLELKELCRRNPPQAYRQTVGVRASAGHHLHVHRAVVTAWTNGTYEVHFFARCGCRESEHEQARPPTWCASGRVRTHPANPECRQWREAVLWG